MNGNVFDAFMAAGSSGNPFAAVGGQILGSMFAPDSDQTASGGTSLSGQANFKAENDLTLKQPLLDFANPVKVVFICAGVFALAVLLKKYRG